VLAWRASVAAARRRFATVRPNAILGLGGYAAGPAVVAARRIGIRTAILNPDAVPGRANRHLAKSADLVVLQWDVSRNEFGPGIRCESLGCPIRPAFATPPDRVTACAHFGFDPQRPVLLVTGASQGARTVNEALRLVWPEFVGQHPEWQLLHLTGAADETAIRAAYRDAAAPAIVMSFTHDMPHALAAANVVISRSGASTLAELTALGRASILLPYPYHRDRHQHANAQVLVDAGAAILLEDWKDAARNSGPLRAALETLADPPVRERMSAAARTLARPGAAGEIARWLLARKSGE
jgi:UDP-N-acetylglucosamine--N-acetylmuramyl-(pentapeptide) pyrophosphoryl-undecaprenol N-acetylglucosamine transferase